MPTHEEKALAFQKLHKESGCFVIPNPWDRGSARMLAKLGFKALATTSAGFDFASGRPDGTASLDEVLAHCRDMATATDLPVSADMENCYADTAEGVADTIRRAAATGLAGCSIEDLSDDRDNPIYEFSEAVDRVSAAVDAVRVLPHPFTLTARAENFIRGNPDLDDTIKRLQAFQEAGADVLYAPGPKSADQISAIITSVDRPVNVIAGLPGMKLTVNELADLGVKRISIGSGLFRVAFGAALKTAHEFADQGTFSIADNAASFAEINPLFLDD
jgi:2-methylisocitrate lyase-like PEP mutase family enzyme